MSASEGAFDLVSKLQASETFHIIDSQVLSTREGASEGSTSPNSPVSPKSGDGEEQALESHEVIELQAFSERKVWIEEKIKFLEKLPPIEVFVGLDAIHASAEEVPGLPTREQLKQWMVEHDRIEKETEIFDSGELKKLKKFTKAAAQRNLSPADTDLIELTLTTIYELDKLLHLLRDRSENLDLLGIRLTWEERRIGAWIELRSTVADIKNFLDERARWTPAVYDTEFANREDEPTPELPITSLSKSRRGSVVSIASIASANSESSMSSSLSFSRGARFQLAEQLSRDAAQLATRVSSLKHSKINAAGKALDKLIDDSRRPVPEELLDEQDRLEDKGINEMEDVGKFIMSIVTQWKKADEIYVETMKDKAALQTLVEEIETAKLNHPNARQDASFLSRSNAVSKRLAMRGNPALSSSTFPLPFHPLFSDQQTSTESILQLLSSEWHSALEYARKAEAYAKEYHAALEAVKKVQTVCKAASECSSQLTSLVDHLEQGVQATNGDGSAPDLTTEACLDSAHHSVYLALLPSLLQKLQSAEEDSGELLPSARAALLALDWPGTDIQFTVDSTAEIDRLSMLRQAAIQTRELVSVRVATLSELRRIWANMESLFKQIENIRFELSEATENQMWKQQAHSGNVLLTPESSVSPLPEPTMPTMDIASQLDTVTLQLEQDISLPLSQIVPSLDPALRAYLTKCMTSLTFALGDTKRMSRFLHSVRTQAAVMTSVQEEVHELQLQMEDIRLRFDSSIQDVLSGTLDENDLEDTHGHLSADVVVLRDTLRTFLDALPRRIPFIAAGEMSGLLNPSLQKRRFTVSSGFSLDVLEHNASLGLPVDPASIDRAVRTDSNSYSMLLAGGLELVAQKENHLHLARLAHAVDIAVASFVEGLQQIEATVESAQSSFNASSDLPPSLEKLSGLANVVDELHRTRLPTVSSSCAALRLLLQNLENGQGSHNSGIQSTMISPRRRAVENTELRFNIWKEGLGDLSERIIQAVQTEHDRLEEARVEAERDRLEAEARANQERMETEARESAEREREHLEAEAREHEERVRAAERRRRMEAEAKENVEREPREGQERLETEAREAEERERQERLKVKVIEDAESDRKGDGSQAEEEIQRLEAKQQEQSSSVIVGTPQQDYSPSCSLVEDVFGVRLSSSLESTMRRESSQLQSLIYSLRQRLKSISINEIAHASARGSSSLPTDAHKISIETQLSSVADEVSRLPASIPSDANADAELRSLRSEVEASSELMDRIRQLAHLATSIHTCDSALSDLLEHVDSFPSPPLGELSSHHISDPSRPPEEQMSARLLFTEGLINDMTSRFTAVDDDIRAVTEHERVLQTWGELHAMGVDRIHGQKSRPGSVVSSGRSSRASVAQPLASTSKSKKTAGYSKLSIGSPGGRFLIPPSPHTRRSASGGAVRDNNVRSSSRLSVASSTRSVSGPIGTPTSRLYNSTFASRQRTTSVSSITSSGATPVKHVFATPSRPRAQTGQMDRTASPAFSETSSISQSRSSLNLSRSSMSRSSWARTPRQSFPTLPRSSPPRTRIPNMRTPYVANPKNKLDVAVGDVVNRLPMNVNINIEVVADTWKDQSGKYWIGNQDPKLCFCRILRSQTVMVRVGGGWSELSKFIKDHFADVFRLLPESPPRAHQREEKWISSTTLSKAAMQSPDISDIPLPPRTPEPKMPFIPSFALSTPSGHSPRSIKSSPSPGSPLTALQFIRRADRESPVLRPETPTKGPRSGTILPTTPARQPAWRP